MSEGFLSVPGESSWTAFQRLNSPYVERVFGKDSIFTLVTTFTLQRDQRDQRFLQLKQSTQLSYSPSFPSTVFSKYTCIRYLWQSTTLRCLKPHPQSFCFRKSFGGPWTDHATDRSSGYTCRITLPGPMEPRPDDI